VALPFVIDGQGQSTSSFAGCLFQHAGVVTCLEPIGGCRALPGSHVYILQPCRGVVAAKPVILGAAGPLTQVPLPWVLGSEAGVAWLGFRRLLRGAAL
jgi:hypothetical protein